MKSFFQIGLTILTLYGCSSSDDAARVSRCTHDVECWCDSFTCSKMSCVDGTLTECQCDGGVE